MFLDSFYRVESLLSRASKNIEIARGSKTLWRQTCSNDKSSLTTRIRNESFPGCVSIEFLCKSCLRPCKANRTKHPSRGAIPDENVTLQLAARQPSVTSHLRPGFAVWCLSDKPWAPRSRGRHPSGPTGATPSQNHSENHRSSTFTSWIP